MEMTNTSIISRARIHDNSDRYFLHDEYRRHNDIQYLERAWD